MFTQCTHDALLQAWCELAAAHGCSIEAVAVAFAALPVPT